MLDRLHRTASDPCVCRAAAKSQAELQQLSSSSEAAGAAVPMITMTSHSKTKHQRCPA